MKRTTRSAITATLSSGKKRVGVQRALQRQQQHQHQDEQQHSIPPALHSVPTPQLSRQGIEVAEEDFIMADPISDIEDDPASGATKKTAQTFTPDSLDACKLSCTAVTGGGVDEHDEGCLGIQHEADDMAGDPEWFRQHVAEARAAATKKKFVQSNAAQPQPAKRARKTLLTYTKKAARVTMPKSASSRSKAKANKQKEILSERTFVPPRGWDSVSYSKDPTDDNKTTETRALMLMQVKTYAATNDIDDDGMYSDRSSVSSSPEATEDGNVKCPICNQKVDVLLKQAFHDEFFLEQHLNFRWQLRFCFYHRRHDAEETWSRRGYPEIDWNRLDLRLRKFHPHLREVLAGERPSRHKERLREKVEKGGKATAQAFQMLGDELEETVAGYYGPRGEQFMMDHILTHLADDIRDHEDKNGLLAAPGVIGGVAGLVQLVLLPELAERLIGEDLGTDNVLLIEDTLRDSAWMGVLLHPEVVQKIAAEADDAVEE